MIDLEKLAKQYCDFVKPCYSILINDTEIGKEFLNQELTVEITTGFEAGFLQFKIYNAFEKDKQKEALYSYKQVTSLLKLGNVVEAKIGYLEKADICVFKGYIDSIYLDYEKDEEIVYTVECLDAKGIMMNSIHSETKKSIKKYSLAAEDILKKYTSLLKLKSTSFYKQDNDVNVPIEQHNESDYQFVVRMAKNIGCEFYIVAGEVVFQPLEKKQKQTAIQYHINAYLENFTIHSSLKGFVNHVMVRNNNEQTPDKPFSAKVSSYTKTAESGKIVASSLSPLLTQRVSKIVTDATVSSQEDAKQKAEAYLYQIVKNTVTGSITTVGIPQLKAGTFCSLKGFGKPFDKTYYISKVIHTIKNGNYKTVCEIEVNEY